MASTSRHELNIIGGSVAGLCAAREASSLGIDTCVFEEHREIGVPEKCDGLVSGKGISELGLVPPSYVVQNNLLAAVFFSPSMKEIKINATKQNVIVIDRSRFDKFLAERAARAGAKLEIGRRVSKYETKNSHVTLKVEADEAESDILLDCGGYESYINSGGTAFQGGQYLVCGDWFQKNTVEVYFDPEAYPAFFKWVIPISSDIAKIGVAGDGINTFSILDQFAKQKGAQVLRKMGAPVLCFGALKSFVEGRIAKVGDAAGQAKPTTGGGIYTGGMGGLFAGRASARALREKDVSLLSNYETDWREKFGKEFRLQLYARKAFSKMTREQIDKLFEMVASSDLPKTLEREGDFDRHSIAFAKAIGFSNLASAFSMVFTNELRNLLGL
ncbi:MAG TPA: NAD(P)/FAD-dependent oxidoreductase [Nitrososphaerales archaeon]|nr:NAD(P)/FAD-dependent oxidoreductase [Nitrososphaerales archaeon]